MVEAKHFIATLVKQDNGMQIAMPIGQESFIVQGVKNN